MSASQSNVVVPNNTSGVDVAAYGVTWAGSPSNVQASTPMDPDSGNHIQITAAGTPGTNGLVVQGTGTSGTVQVSGNVGVSGSVTVSNFPASQTVAGSVSVSNFPATQSISGTVSVGNFPSGFGNGVNGSGTAQFIPLADSSAFLNVSTSGTTAVITGVVNKKIYVTGFDFTSNGSGTVQFVHGSGNTAVTGPYAVVAQFGASRGGGMGAIWTIPAGDSLSVTLTGSATVQGSISYTQF